jgi:hypothetical protein
LIFAPPPPPPKSRVNTHSTPFSAFGANLGAIGGHSARAGRGVSAVDAIGAAVGGAVDSIYEAWARNPSASKAWAEKLVSRKKVLNKLSCIPYIDVQD